MHSFLTRAALLAALAAAEHPVFGQAAAVAAGSAAPFSAWLDSVRQLPLPRQLVAVHRQMLRDTAYRSGFQPALCRGLVGTVNGLPAPATIRVADRPADTRPPGATLFYIVDGYPAENTSAGVAGFWQQVASRRIRQVVLLPGSAAVAIYGTRGANGVVILSSAKPTRP